MKNLEKYGANERFLEEAKLYPDLCLGRVVSQYKDLYRVANENGEYLAQVSGKLRYKIKNPAEFPVVGDFVMLNRNSGEDGNLIIYEVLTRKSVFERRSVGNSNRSQIIASNIDIVFICMSMNKDYNLSRLERYISVAWESGATPVIVLTKSDLCDDISGIISQVSSVSIGIDIVFTSSHDRNSHRQLLTYLEKGKTASFIGSSGVGKSTLVNLLLGNESLPTSGLRNDDKGRHTTTNRELLVLPHGGIVIDTPGMRELGIDSADLTKAFSDIDQLSKECRFRNCTHKNEPGCAILKALGSGDLDPRRFENYKKLKKEAKYEGLTSKQIEHAKLDEMFGEIGGMKKAKAFIKQKKKSNR